MNARFDEALQKLQYANLLRNEILSLEMRVKLAMPNSWSYFGAEEDEKRDAYRKQLQDELDAKRDQLVTLLLNNDNTSEETA